MRHRDPHDDPPARRQRRPPEPIPTLGELHRQTPWLWVFCAGCGRSSPAALAPFVIRWGPWTSSDRLRQTARCTACGHRGATLQHPSWIGLGTGFQAFPEKPA